MALALPGPGPFWPHTTLGSFWPVSHLDSLWDLSIHTPAEPLPSSPLVASGTEAGTQGGSGVDDLAGFGDLSRYCEPIGLGETKYRCTLDGKLFRTPEFVYKHIVNKYVVGAGGVVQAKAVDSVGMPAPKAAAPAPQAAPAFVPPPREASAPNEPAAEAPSASFAEQLRSRTDFLIEEVEEESTRPEATPAAPVEAAPEPALAPAEPAAPAEPVEPAQPAAVEPVVVAGPVAAETAAAEPAVARSIEDYCKKYGEGKYQCTICGKMFKGPDFVFKHIRQKHPAELEALGKAPAAPCCPAKAEAEDVPESQERDDVESRALELVAIPEGYEAGQQGAPCNDRPASIAFPDTASGAPEPAPAGREPRQEMAGIEEAGPEGAETSVLGRGCRVEITGLSGRADLNGSRGIVQLKEGSTGRFEVAIDGSDERVRVKPENLVLLTERRREKWRMGDMAFREGKTEQAIAFYSSALGDAAAGDAEVALRCNLAAALTRKKEHKAALEEAEKVLKQRPNWATALSRKALSLLELKRAAEAQSAYIKGLQFEPAHEACVAGLRRATEELVKPSERAAEGERKRLKGNEAAKVGDLPAAVALYTMALALLEPLAGAMPRRLALCASSRSAVFAKLQQWDFALWDARRAEERRPGWFQARFRVAQALLGQGHAELGYLASLGGEVPESLAAEAASSCLQALWLMPSLESPLARRRMQRFEEDACRPKGSSRIFAISGVHLDQEAGAAAWAEGLSSTEYADDVLMVSSLGDTLNAIRRGLEILKSKFRRVFYVPGNHDLWLRSDTEDVQGRGYRNSVEKFLALLDLCDGVGAEMMAAEVMQNVFVVPLLSWWTSGFSNDPPGSEAHDTFAKWPMGDEGAQEFFLRWNEPCVKRLEQLQRERHGAGDVVSMSHFLPCRELLPAGSSAMGAGCPRLEEQLRRLGSRVHLYGHGRRGERRELRGVTYVQHALMGPDFSCDDAQQLLLLHSGGELRLSGA